MKRSLPFALFLTCLGCTAVGPDYVAPETPAPTTPLLASDDEGITTLLNWWTHFNDPLLTEVITLGLQNSPTIEAARQRLRASRSSRESVEASYYPKFTAGGSYIWSRNWDGANPSDDWNKNFNASADARWEIDLFGSLQRSVEQAVAREEQLAYTLEDARVSLAAEIATAYVDMRRQMQQLKIAEENLALQERSRQRLKRMADLGDIPPYDFYSSEAQVARTRASIPNLRQNLLAAQLRLDLLTGQPPYAMKERFLGTEDQMTFPEKLPIRLPNEILRARADVRSAEAAVRAQTAAIGIATAEIYPKLSLSGNIGVSSPSLTSWSDVSKNLSLGPSLSWNLFSFGYWRNRIAAEEATLQATIADYTNTVLQAYQEAETAWNAYHNERQRSADLTLTRDATQKALDAAERRYEFGYTDIENVLTQQSNLLSAQENLITHRATAFNHLIALYKSLGGGWSENTTPPSNPTH